jgi:uncharacterized protein with FMN-binding domain
MDALGSAYFNLMEDWARAAFWWRKTEARGALSWHATLRLAECYWRLGSRELAIGMLREASEYYAADIIKLWACLGDLDKALREAEGMAKAGAPDDAYLAAGDACRFSGKCPQAIAYYRKVLDVPATGREQKRIERNQARARASKEAVETFETIDLKRVPDGTYKASSVAYERTLEVAVTVKGSRIESVRVTQHHEKQYYTALTATPREIVEKQTVKGIEAVSGATITSEAVINATAKALSAAMK